MNKNVYLSIVLPIFNEEKMIEATIIKVIDSFHNSELDLEIIAVNDGSQDKSKEILIDLHNKYPELIKVINHPYNKGNGAAIKSGIRNSSGEFIACMDIDGQHDPEDLKNMLRYKDDFDLIVGARPKIRNAEWYRTLANNFYNSFASSLTGFEIEDLTSGFRLFRASVVKKFVHLFPQKFSYPTTSTLAILKGGYNLKYVPINIRPRQAGKSKIKLLEDGWRFILIILKIVILFEPLRVFIPITVFSFGLALISTLITIVLEQRMHIPNSSVIFFVLAILTFLLGIIAEQLTAIQITVLEKENKNN